MAPDTYISPVYNGMFMESPVSEGGFAQYNTVEGSMQITGGVAEVTKVGKGFVVSKLSTN